MAYTVIAHPTEADLQHFRTLRGRTGQLDEGIFIAESPKIVERVLASDMAIEVLYVTSEFFENLSPVIEARHETIRIIVAPKEEMEHIVGYHLHQGVMLAAKVPKRSEHATSEEVVSLIRGVTGRRIIVALDSIADPENMGGIIRTCAAFGVDALLVDEQSCHPFLRRSVRVSMGNITNIPIFRVKDLHETLRLLKREGKRVSIFGAALTSASVPLDSVVARPAGNQSGQILIFGSEGEGIRPSILELCDLQIEIPMANSVSSLNVGVACGVVLYKFLHR